jgi:hypothetical protein
MIVFGAYDFGQTRRVPGVLSVRTRFLHVMFFPIVPRSSWVIPHPKARESMNLEEAYRLEGLNWRSVLLAWIRAPLVLLLLVSTVVIATQILLDRALSDMLPALTTFVFGLLVFILSYALDRADPDELVGTLNQAGLPPALVELAKQSVGGAS